MTDRPSPAVKNGSPPSGGGMSAVCKAVLTAALAVTLALLSSCRSVPPVVLEREDGAVFIPLEPGGFAYLLIDVERARPILDGLNFRGMDTTDRRFRQILDRTRSAMAAVYMSGDGEPSGTRFRLVARGSYPASRARMAMGGSRHWRRQRSGVTGDRYWHSGAGMISVAMNRSEALVSTSLEDLPVDPFYVGQGTRIPDGFDAFRGEALLSGWMDGPDTVINRRLAEMHIPLEIPAEMIFFSLAPVEAEGEDAKHEGDASYEVRLRVRVASAIQARGFATVLAIASGLFQPAAGGSDAVSALMSILLANPPVPDDRYLHIRTDPMSAGEIRALLGSLGL